jgi:hypothetical protein
LFLLTNEYPVTGLIEAPTGTNLLDPVDLVAPGWVDNDFPLRYVFSLIQGNDEIFLTELLDSPSAQTIIPIAGSSQIRVRVFDTQGAMALRTANFSTRNLSSSDLSRRISELQTSFGQRAAWGDLRGASQLSVALLIAQSRQNYPLLPQLREEVLSLLSSSLAVRKLAWVDSPSVINLLSLIIKGNETLSQSALENCTRIIEDSVAAASTQTPNKLSVTSSQLARFTTFGFLNTAIGISKSVSQASQSSATISSRIRAAIESLVLLQTRFIVADELAAQIISESVIATAIVVSNRTITESGGKISVANVTIALTPTSGAGDVSIGIITWKDGSFYLGEKGGTVIQLLFSSGAGASAVSAEFDSQPNANGGRCAILNESTKKWDDSTCSSKTQPNGNVLCECSVTSASGGANRVALSLLFDTSSFDQRTPSLVPTVEAVGAPVGAIVGAVVAVVVLIVGAVLLVLLVPAIKQKVLPYNRTGANGMNHELGSIDEGEPRPESKPGWAVGSKPTTS